MIQEESTYQQTLSTWLLRLSLLLSLFVISGFVSHFQAPKESITTELVNAQKSRSSKRTVSYVKAIHFLHSSFAFISFKPYNNYILKACQSSYRVELKHISKQIYSFTIPIHFSSIKVIFYSSKGDYPSTSIG